MKRKGCLFWFGLPVLLVTTIIMSIQFLHSQRVCISQMRVIPDEEVMLEAMRNIDVRFGNRDVARAYLKDNPNCCRLYHYGEDISRTHPDGNEWVGDGGQMAYFFFLDVKTIGKYKYEPILQSKGGMAMSSCNEPFFEN